jgi:uncharacterized protein (DUF2141 family)
MKKTLRAVIFCLLFPATQLAWAQSATLEVNVTNIKSTKGTIRVGLFTTEDNFLKKAVKGKVIPATPGEIMVRFENLEPGIYAVSVIHDENENGELDKNIFGIPKEGFAFGNNAMGNFGPPSFQEAKITLADTDLVRQVINLRYM